MPNIPNVNMQSSSFVATRPSSSAVTDTAATSQCMQLGGGSPSCPPLAPTAVEVGWGARHSPAAVTMSVGVTTSAVALPSSVWKGEHPIPPPSGRLGASSSRTNPVSDFSRLDNSCPRSPASTYRGSDGYAWEVTCFLAIPSRGLVGYASCCPNSPNAA